MVNLEHKKGTLSCTKGQLLAEIKHELNKAMNYYSQYLDKRDLLETLDAFKAQGKNLSLQAKEHIAQKYERMADESREQVSIKWLTNQDAERHGYSQDTFEVKSNKLNRIIRIDMDNEILEVR